MEITSIIPNEFTKTEENVKIIGQGFQIGTTVFLRKDNLEPIDARELKIITEKLIHCRLPLEGVESGKWDVVVVSPQFKEFTFFEGFEVKKPTS